MLFEKFTCPPSAVANPSLAPGATSCTSCSMRAAFVSARRRRLLQHDDVGSADRRSPRHRRRCGSARRRRCRSCPTARRPSCRCRRCRARAPIGFLHGDRLALDRAGEFERTLHSLDGRETVRPYGRTRRPQRQISLDQARIERADRLEPESLEGEHAQRLGRRRARLQLDVDEHVVVGRGQMPFHHAGEFRVVQLVQRHQLVQPLSKPGRLCRRGPAAHDGREQERRKSRAANRRVIMMAPFACRAAATATRFFTHHARRV